MKRVGGQADGGLNSPISAIYTMDNLKVLRGLNSECVDLIYLDPPFNTGREWHNPIGDGGGKVGFSDIWGWDRQTGETLAETIERQWEEERDYAGTAVREVVEAAVAAHGPQMGSYCAWMAPRIIELHRVLNPTGSIYLHCDPTTGAYLRALMDAVFGAGQYRNEVEWKRTSSRSDAQRFGRIHDRLLYYAKGRESTWNGAWEKLDPEYLTKRYSQKDAGGRWQSDQLTAAGLRNGDSGQPWRGVDPATRGNHWRAPSALPEWARASLPENFPELLR